MTIINKMFHFGDSSFYYRLAVSLLMTSTIPSPPTGGRGISKLIISRII
jgi:hypothetical protein